MFHKINPASRHFLGLYRFLSVMICLALLLGAPAAGFAAPVGNENAAPQTADIFPARTVIVHLWEWKWTDIAKECETVLDPKGYAAVQVSPPNEHAWAKTNGVYPWWLRYQPVTYNITASRSGTLNEFQDMVTRCNKVNVNIYVDAVINHMTGVASSPSASVYGYGGTNYDPYYNASFPEDNTDSANYASQNGMHFPTLGPGTQMCGGVPCGFGPSDFHYCGTAVNPGDGVDTPNDIPDSAYGSNAWQVRNCELVNLSDLKTENSYVRERLVAYLNYLVSLGVDGFRIDAAKHMAPADIQSIVTSVKAYATTGGFTEPYFYQEVIDRNGTETITKWEYNTIADVKEFKAEGDMSYTFRNSTINKFLTPVPFGEGWGLLPSDQAVTFVVNHDDIHHPETYLTYKDMAKYKLANIFMLAYPYGYPKVMSSYDFTTGNFDESPPANTDGSTINVWTGDVSICPADSQITSNSWVCEHRWQSIAGMVGFRNFTQSYWGITNLWNNGSDAIAFGRGGKGFVVINNEPSTALINQSLPTGMPDGAYCNVIKTEVGQNGKCADQNQVIRVTNGNATFNVIAQDAVAIHIGAVETAAPIVYAPVSVSIEMVDSDCKINTACTFRATVTPNSADPEGDNTYPLTYEWSANGQSPDTHENVGSLTDTVSFTWDAEGDYMVSVTVSNDEGEKSATFNATATPAYPLIVTFDLQGVPVSTKVIMYSDNPLLNGQRLRNENGIWTVDIRVIADSNEVTTLVFYYTRKVGLRSYTETVTHTCVIPSGFHSEWDCTDGWNVAE